MKTGIKTDGGFPSRNEIIMETGTGVMPNGATTMDLPHTLGMKPHNVIINSDYESENYRMKTTADTWTNAKITVTRQLAVSTGDKNFNYTIIGIKKSMIPR